MVTIKNHGIRIYWIIKKRNPYTVSLAATLHSAEHIAINIVQAAQVVCQ